MLAWGLPGQGAEKPSSPLALAEGQASTQSMGPPRSLNWCAPPCSPFLAKDKGIKSVERQPQSIKRECGDLLSLEPCSIPWVTAHEAGLPEGGTQLRWEGQSPNFHPSNKAPDMQGCRGSVGVCAQHVYLGAAFCAPGCAHGGHRGSGEQSLGLNPSSTTYKLWELRQVTSLLRASLSSSAKWGQKYQLAGFVRVSSDYIKC